MRCAATAPTSHACWARLPSPGAGHCDTKHTDTEASRIAARWEPAEGATSRPTGPHTRRDDHRYMDVFEEHSQRFIDRVLASDDRVVTLTPELESCCLQMFAKVRP
jgi:hypothetical protein